VKKYHSAIFLAEDLLDARGVSEESRRTFRLGVVEDPIEDHEPYEGMLCIPYLDRLGRVLKVRFRRLEGSGPKYMDLPHEHSRIFNTKAIFEADSEIHVTEGEMDCIILTQLGYHAIALPGAQMWQKHHTKVLAGFNRIICWGDPDDGGKDFNEKIKSSMRTAQSVKLTIGDVNETYLKGGPEAIEEAIGRLKW